MAILDEVGAYIDAQTSLTLGTDLFLGLRPDTPIDCATIYEYPGDMPRYTLGSGALVERPRLQVISRSAVYATARSRAQTIWNALNALSDQTLTATRYLRVAPMQTPYLMGRDENRNALIAFNCTVDKEV